MPGFSWLRAYVPLRNNSKRKENWLVSKIQDNKCSDKDLHVFNEEILKMALGLWLEMWPSNVQTGPSGRGQAKYTEMSEENTLKYQS